MAKSHRRWRESAVLAFVVVLSSCGGDGGSSAEGGLPADTGAAGQQDGQEMGAPRVEEDDRGVEGVVGGLTEDSAGLVDFELPADETPDLPRPIRIPAGTRIDAAPGVDISTDAYGVDDPVIVTVTRDVLGRNGELLLPRGVRLLGRVRASMSSGGLGEPAVLEIDFETLSADRWERPIEGAVVNRPVILDPVADRRRRSASGRSRTFAVVPGLIMSGTIIVIELRAPMFVPASRTEAADGEERRPGRNPAVRQG